MIFLYVLYQTKTIITQHIELIILIIGTAYILLVITIIKQNLTCKNHIISYNYSCSSDYFFFINNNNINSYKKNNLNLLFFNQKATTESKNLYLNNYNILNINFKFTNFTIFYFTKL